MNSETSATAGPPPGMTSVAYRSFPVSGSTSAGPMMGGGGGGSFSPPPASPPSPPPTMPGRECKFCKNNGETTQMYRLVETRVSMVRLTRHISGNGQNDCDQSKDKS